MAIRPKYKTRQRERLLEYFTSVPGRHITAGDVCEYLKEEGESIAQATVYRQLDSLVEEGILVKYNVEPGCPSCYEYLGEDHPVNGETCFHCKCTKCGKLIHLHCEEVEELTEHLDQEHKFRLDPRRTVFYGVCEDCR